MSEVLMIPYIEEVWKDIPEYEGLYQGSNFFKIRSLDHWVTNGKGKYLVKGQLLTQIKEKDTGYLTVRLCKNCVSKKHYVHRIMAELFIPNPDNLPTVDHINRIRDDKKITNLRWAPYKLQAQNRTIKKKKTPKKKILLNKQNINGKPVIQLSKDGHFVAEYTSVMEAERETGICFTNISMCCLGKNYRHTAGGYQWCYK